MSKRVLLISNMYPSSRDPAYGSFVERCVLGLVDAGFPVDRVVMSRQSSPWAKLAAYLRMWALANARLVFGGHDCVYVHHPLHSLAVCLPGLFFSRARLVLNFHGHDLVPVTRRGRVLQRMLSPVHARAHTLLFPSRHFKAIYERGFAVPAAQRRVAFASGGVSEIYFEGEAPLPPAERPRSALFLSRWEAGKGWREFLDLACRLVSEFPDFSFTLAGAGDDRPHIERSVAALGLQHVVRLVESTRPDSNKALFRRHRYFVLPSSLEESLALVNLEAMASGCITLSSRFAAATEYLQSGHNGHLVDRDGFAAACAGLIRQLEARPAEAAAMAVAGMRSAAGLRESEQMRSLPAALGLVGEGGA